MQTEALPAYSFTPVDTGVDWITATAKTGLEGRPFREQREAIIDSERVAGGDVRPATLRDYTGYRGDGWFCGARADDQLIIASGSRAPALWESIARAASNVSRLDLQVSVWTHGEQPELAREAYHYLRKLPPGRGRPRSLTLIQSHPKGETLNVGRRVSDAYGRLYDWSAAHSSGEARTIWRYEVEFKRHYAMRQTTDLLSAADYRTHTSHTVHSWFKVRGVALPWSDADCGLSSQQPLREARRDTLDWFERCLRVTIAKEINRVGLPRVLSALGLSGIVQPIERRKDAHADESTGALPAQAHRRDTRAGD